MTPPTKRTVYAVSEGAWSDYMVHALFEDRSEAEATAERLRGFVEEFDLYPPGSGNVISPRLRHIAFLRVSAEGVLQDDDPHPSSYYVAADDEPARPRVVAHTYVTPNYFEVNAQADDQETAVKTVRERAALVASLIVEGGDPLAADIP